MSFVHVAVMLQYHETLLGYLSLRSSTSNQKRDLCLLLEGGLRVCLGLKGLGLNVLYVGTRVSILVFGAYSFALKVSLACALC